MPGEWFRPHLERVDAWYQQLQPRERVLVLVAVCGVVIASWDFLLLQPIEADIRARKAEVVSARASLQAAEGEQTMLNAQLQANPNQALQDRVNATWKQARAVGRQLVDSSDAWISPGYMVEALHAILQERPGVRLLALRSLPPRQVGAEPAAGGGQVGGEDIYEHAVEITLEADYFSLLAYIEALEASHWRFIWDRLDYEVTGHPLARVQLRLKTLSATREVLEIGT